MNLKDYGVAAARARHPALRRKPAIARGCFGAVFEGRSPDTVLKLTLDGMHHAYLTDGCFAPRGPHAPRLVEDFGPVGENGNGDEIFLVEVERLVPIPRASAQRRLLTKAMRHVLGKGRGELPEDSAQLPGLAPSLAQFFAQVNTFTLNFGCKVDCLVGSNYMLRPADGTLVASDPVYDQRMVETYARRQSRMH